MSHHSPAAPAHTPDSAAKQVAPPAAISGKKRMSWRADNRSVFLIVLGSIVAAAVTGAATGVVRPAEHAVALGGDSYTTTSFSTSPDFIATMLTIGTASLIAVIAATTLWAVTAVRPLILAWAAIIGAVVTITVAELTTSVQQTLIDAPSTLDALAPGTQFDIPVEPNLAIVGLLTAPALAATWYWILVWIVGDSPKARKAHEKAMRREQSGTAPAPAGLAQPVPASDGTTTGGAVK